MPIAIVVLLVWLLPVVIHAYKESRQTYGFRSIKIKTNKAKQRRNDGMDWDKIYMDEHAMCQSEFGYNFAMLIPMQAHKPYDPDARWETTDGVINLYHTDRFVRYNKYVKEDVGWKLLAISLAVLIIYYLTSMIIYVFLNR